MACGCSRNMKGVAKGPGVTGPIRNQQVRSASAQRTIANQISPVITAQSMPVEAQNAPVQGMDEERRRVERLRREAIKKALNH